MNTYMIGKNLMRQLPEREYFYSHLIVQDITNSDYTPTKSV